MPQLPDFTALGQPTPVSERPIGSYRAGVAQEAAAQADERLAGAGESAVKLGAGIQQQQDDINYAAGVSAIYQEKVQADADFQNDPDYATAPQRYNARLSAAADRISATIMSPARRADFDAMVARRVVAYGTEDQQNRAHAKSIDADRAFLTDRLQANTNTALQTTDDATRGLLLQNSAALIDGMLAKGSITAVEAQKLKTQIPADYAEAYLQQLSPVERLKLLNPAPAGTPVPALPGDVGKIVSDTATKYGISPASFAKAAQIESQGKSDIVNSSGHAGLFQLSGDVADQYGVTNRLDPQQNAEGAAKLWNANAAALTTDLGRPPTDAEVYLAHQQGETGAAALLAHPEEKAVDVLRGVYGNSRQAIAAITQNGGKADMTAGDFAKMWADRFNGAPTQMPADAGSTRGGTSGVLYPRTGTPVDFLPIDKRIELTQQAQQQAYTEMEREITWQNHQDSQAEKALKQTQAQNTNDGIAAAISGQPWDNDKLANMLRTNQLSDEGYKAIVAAATGRKQQDQPEAVFHLYGKLSQGTLNADDIFTAYHSGVISDSTATALAKAASDPTAQTARDPVEKQSFATLKSALAAGVDQGFINLDPGADRIAAAQLWARAQMEWTDRVMVKKQDPRAVLSDMLTRYSQPVTKASAFPMPRMGAVKSLADVMKVAKLTVGAHDNGTLTDEEYSQEVQLLSQLRNFWQAEEERAAARQGAPKPPSGGAKPLGVVPEGTP